MRYAPQVLLVVVALALVAVVVIAITVKIDCPPLARCGVITEREQWVVKQWMPTKALRAGGYYRYQDHCMFVVKWAAGSTNRYVLTGQSACARQVGDRLVSGPFRVW
jgi:hypothetical protein